MPSVISVNEAELEQSRELLRARCASSSGTRSPRSSSASPVGSRSVSGTSTSASPSPALADAEASPSSRCPRRSGPRRSSTTPSLPAAGTPPGGRDDADDLALAEPRPHPLERNRGVAGGSSGRQRPDAPRAGRSRSREPCPRTRARRRRRRPCLPEADRRRGRRARRRDRRRGRDRARRAPRRGRRARRGRRRARGATLFVTLEPCSHQGTTPPCTDRCIAEGVARVVVGARDPNPEAAGGIEVLRGRGRRGRAPRLPGRRACRTRRGASGSRSGRPFVTYKVAMTLDGRVAVPGRRWVSGEESRRLVHELRAASDAVAVGMGTVRADAPRLDARDVPSPARPAAPARVRPRAASRRVGARAAPGPARGRAARARRRGRPVAPARGRADARRRVPRRPASSTSCSSSSRRCSPAATGRACSPRLAIRRGRCPT